MTSLYQLATFENAAKAEVDMCEKLMRENKAKRCDVYAQASNWMKQVGTPRFLQGKGKHRSPLFWLITTAHRTMLPILGRLCSKQEKEELESYYISSDPKQLRIGDE